MTTRKLLFFWWFTFTALASLAGSFSSVVVGSETTALLLAAFTSCAAAGAFLLADAVSTRLHSGPLRAALASVAGPALFALSRFIGLSHLPQYQYVSDGAEIKVANEVVYNAKLAPQLPRDPAAPSRSVLKAGLSTTLRFDIGPKWPDSDLPVVAPAAEIVKSAEDLPLTVVLACDLCEPHADWLKRTVFRPARGRADEVSFQFTPQHRQDSNNYFMTLQLGIINDKTGRAYDHLVVPVAVSENGAPNGSAPSSPITFLRSEGTSRTDWRADVELYAMEENGRNVSISIEPLSEEMKQRLDSLALDTEGKRRVFRSGIDDAQLIDAMTRSAYGAISAVSMQGALLKKLSATGTDAVVSKAHQKSLKLTETESRNVAEVIAQTGQSLYRHLFSDSVDKNLPRLIKALEAAAAEEAHTDKPLRMVVITNRLSLPWQYLLPTGPVDAANFWGMRFSLSVQRTNNNAGGKAAAPALDQARKVVFAHYGSSADPSVPLAKKQAAQLLMMPLPAADLVQVDTGADLLRTVSAERKHIAGIVTFLHASAGSADEEPELQFNDGDLVNSTTLENLLNKRQEQDSPYLPGAPLIILNACETGPSRSLPHVSLENVMFQLGAEGVVATEVSVWISLGHEVATLLISRLNKGEPVSDALTAVRRELLMQKKNPLGLLYVYYGEPDATLRRISGY